MKIGILNERLDNISYGVNYSGSILSPRLEKNGNPLKGEPLLMKWDEVRDSDVEIKLQLDQMCFADRVVLSLGEHTELTCVILRSGKDVLYHFTSETNTTIRQKRLELEAGVVVDSLGLIVNGDFSDIEIQNIQLYGALEDGIDLFPTPSVVHMEERYVPIQQYKACIASCEEGQGAGTILAEKFEEKTGVSLSGGAESWACIFYDSYIP